MQNEAITAGYLLRLIGFFGMMVGVAWAIQTIGFGEATLATKLMWVVAAASMCGAGAGLLVASAGVSNDAARPVRA